MFGTRLARLLRRRRTVVALLLVVVFLGLQLNDLVRHDSSSFPQSAKTTNAPSDVLSDATGGTLPMDAVEALEGLAVKGRAAKTGYARSQFGDGWAAVNGCDMRNLILQRDMQAVVLDIGGCKVIGGVLQDPYTAKTIQFMRGETTSDDVQIDHVVALSDAWQKGAQVLDVGERERFANDALNLLAVDGDTNQKKGDSDAASWLPPNKDFRCRYVARQIAVKAKYRLWVTEAEATAMQRVLSGCPGQSLPREIVYGVENGAGD